jgi:hypothetical protein
MPDLVIDSGFDHGLTSTSARWEGFARTCCRIGSGSLTKRGESVKPVINILAAPL